MAPDQPSNRQVVRVIPDVAGLDAEFDYLVPAEIGRLEVGMRVRVPLNGRSVAAWVSAVDTDPPPGKRLLVIKKVSGLGPSSDLMDLTRWAAHRWAGRRTAFLKAGSPTRNVMALPAVTSTATSSAPEVENNARSGADLERIVRWPPASDPQPLIEEALANGPALILTPSIRGAERLAQRLNQSGHKVVLHPEGWARAAAGGISVVGTMSAAWAPMPVLRSVLVIDAHDASYRQEGAPTWDAIEVVTERARRAGASCTLVSPTPRLEHLVGRNLVTVDRGTERDGWAKQSVVDVRDKDPHSGLYSPAVVKVVRGTGRVICVLNRKGRSTRLVCHNCGETAHCERCQGELVSLVEHQLHCRRCRNDQPEICSNCGAQKFKLLRVGVSKVREELEVLAGRPVGEVVGETSTLPNADVLVGTEAVLHRVGRADAVVFLDFDKELLSSSIRANEDALILLARASRILRGHSGGVMIVQTRQPDHPVVQAALHGDPSVVIEPEQNARRMLGWPPYGAIATLSGANAEAFVASAPENLMVLQDQDGRWLLQADNAEVLADALAAMKRPPGRLGLQVNPYRI